MIRRKKEVKRIFFTVLFVISIFLSNVLILNNINVFQDENTNNEVVLDKLPLNTASDLDYVRTGSGVNQDVRIYTNNESENLLNNENYFEIPGLTTEDMYLSYGNFNFTFQNNFTTDYVIEDDDALYPADFISFDYETNPAYSGITVTEGEIKAGDFNDITDGSNSTFMRIEAGTNVLNFTISANFTDTSFTIGGLTGDIEFNRSRILGLIYSLIYRLNDTADLTVRMRDYSQPTWIDIITTLPVESSPEPIELLDRAINENLNFIDLSDTCFIQFIFESTSPLMGWIYNFDMESTYAFDLPITNQQYVALEFDLKGKDSAVNGFYAWIRTLDPAQALTSELNITLYRSNITVVRNDNNLRNIDLGPDYNEMIDTRLVSSYTGDELSYFEFNLGNTGNLELNNYFIVIKSNNADEVYSLVTIPYFNFGDDGRTEHQLKTTLNDGGLWRTAVKYIPATGNPYFSGQLDASSFKLNVTRGYMPSDFIVDSINTLRIQNITINNLEDSSYPYNDSSYLTWGLGQWINQFPTPIEEPTNNFQVDLTWNKSIIKGFQFQVNYSVNAYWIESASSTYSATYDSNPEWLLNYDLQKGDPKFNDWTFLEFWYIYPDFLTAHNLTDPGNNQILGQTEGQSVLSENPSKNKVNVPSNVATLDGFYSLNLTSFNFIRKMDSYINYSGILWESNGFMNGDSISVSVEVQDHKLKAPTNGNANATLYYPDGSQFTSPLLDPSGETKGSSFLYDFNNDTILDVTNALTTFGEYHLGFFWSNGSAIGCKKIILYIDTYDLDLIGCEYNPTLRKNALSGQIYNEVFNNFTLLIASINETTGLSLPNFYPINNEDVDTQFSLEIGDEQIPVLITSFKQSQNILNQNEMVNIKTTIQNLHPFIPVRVKINVKLVAYMNDEWIIAEDTSSNVILNFSGHPDDNSEFDIDLTIPDLNEATNVWLGDNAPVRLGGAKTLITVYVDNVDVGIYESPDISLLSNKTSNDFEGHIIGLKVLDEATAEGILTEFARDECLYLPNTTKFLVNIIDRNYVSSYQQFTNEFTLKLNSKFTNISISPSNPIKGLPFNISSILATEFGVALANRNVTCQYYDSGIWINIDSDFTDSNGFTTFMIDTQAINFVGDLLLRLSWIGNTINGGSKNVTVSVVHEANNLSLSITPNEVLIYRERLTSFNVRLHNIGASNLRITNISIEINRNQAYSIVQIDYHLLDWFPAGENTLLIIEVSVKDVNNVRISISITAQNIITNESIVVSEEAVFGTFEITIFDSIVQNFLLVMIAAFALVWILAIVYARKTKKRIETPIEEPAKRRRGKYVPVAELKKPPPVKKVAKKKEEPKEEKTDLDSLLEERGLADKKKKSEK